MCTNIYLDNAIFGAFVWHENSRVEHMPYCENKYPSNIGKHRKRVLQMPWIIIQQLLSYVANKKDGTIFIAFVIMTVFFSSLIKARVKVRDKISRIL